MKPRIQKLHNYWWCFGAYGLAGWGANPSEAYVVWKKLNRHELARHIARVYKPVPENADIAMRLAREYG
jgi:hypothetical protein